MENVPCKVFFVDAFTKQPFSGNPAAVCLLTAETSDTWQQTLAAEFNLSETAFARPHEGGEPGHYRLRWFTPRCEVDLCGHATLATAHILWEQGLFTTTEALHFHTRSGILTASQRQGRIVLDFPAEPATTIEIPLGLKQALGVEPTWVGRNRMDLLVEVETAREVVALQPDMAALTQLPVRGVIVTARADGTMDADIVSRFFAPQAGIPEDPVTGSAHCCLGPHWQARLGSRLHARQLSPRGGEVWLEIRGERVELEGQATTVMAGSLSPALNSFPPVRP